MTLSEYLEIVKKQIRQEQMREELAEELRCHVEDQAEVYEELGYSPEMAMDRAVADMGDPVETGVQLDLVHQPRLDKKLLWMIVGIWFLGGLFQFLAWAMGVFGTQRIFQVDRIVVYFVILLGFVYMAVRKYDLSREKELEQNWIILILTGSILGILDIFLFQNTGKFALIKVVAFALALEGYAFLTFRYRNQGKEKRNQLFFMAGISCLASCLTGSYFFALLYMLGYTWILTIAFERNWYPKEKAIYAKLWILPGILAVTGMGILGRGWMENQYGAAIASYLKQRDMPGLFYNLLGEYGWVGITIWGILIFVFFLWLIWNLHRITNEMAYMNCLGIVLALGIMVFHSVFCVLGFGNVKMIHFPLFSIEDTSFSMASLLSYFLIGDFLQFHKNSPVIPGNRAG